jgi:hypothetical protein
MMDVQLNFISEGGYFDRLGKKYPETRIDREFVASTISGIKIAGRGLACGGPGKTVV